VVKALGSVKVFDAGRLKRVVALDNLLKAGHSLLAAAIFLSQA